MFQKYRWCKLKISLDLRNSLYTAQIIAFKHSLWRTQSNFNTQRRWRFVLLAAAQFLPLLLRPRPCASHCQSHHECSSLGLLGYARSVAFQGIFAPRPVLLQASCRHHRFCSYRSSAWFLLMVSSFSVRSAPVQGVFRTLSLPLALWL